MFSWTRSVQFRHSCWSTLAIYQKFLSSNSEKVKEYFSYKLFSKDSSGHIKCSFEYPAKSFLTKPEQFLWKFRKLWKLPWTVLSDTWNTVVVFHQENSQKIWKKIAQFPELIDNFFSRENVPGMFLWTCRRQFWHSCRNNWASPNSFRSTSYCVKWNSFFKYKIYTQNAT